MSSQANSRVTCSNIYPKLLESKMTCTLNSILPTKLTAKKLQSSTCYLQDFVKKDSVAKKEEPHSSFTLLKTSLTGDQIRHRHDLPGSFQHGSVALSKPNLSVHQQQIKLLVEKLAAFPPLSLNRVKCDRARPFHQNGATMEIKWQV
ncbi:hypothetical protein Plhal304r1_c047g0128381 [Plasmopara halstedii]